MTRKSFKPLRAILFEKDMNQDDLAFKIKKTKSYLSYRMSGRVPFSIIDIKLIGNALEIPKEQWGYVFVDENAPCFMRDKS